MGRGCGGQVVSRVRVPSPGFDSRNIQTCLQEPSVLKKMLWKRMEEQWLQLLCLTGLNKQSLRTKVGRAVASNTQDPGFESTHRQNFRAFLSISCTEDII